MTILRSPKGRNDPRPGYLQAITEAFRQLKGKIPSIFVLVVQSDTYLHFFCPVMTGRITPPPLATLVRAIRPLAGEIYQPEYLTFIKSHSREGSRPSFAMSQFFLSHSRHMGLIGVDKSAEIITGTAVVAKVGLQMAAELDLWKCKWN